jgi:hypothetical protein
LGAHKTTKNIILIDIVERLLPQGLEAWREVAVVYQRERVMKVPFTKGRTFVITGPGSYATACRSGLENLV